MTSELDVALAAVEDAARLLRQHFADGVEAEWKGRADLVTVADREAESVVRAHVADAFGDPVVGEEGAQPPEAEVAGGRRWYVDPLDGTTNFVKGQPRWGVAVAFCGPDDRIAAAVVGVPERAEVFAAVRGEGATLNGRRLAVPDVETAEALTLLGPLNGLTPAVPAIARQVLSIRITGSTVCDLADVAAGRADAYLGTHQGRWDLAAGTLLAAEAGALVTDVRGDPVRGPATEAFVAGPTVHAALLPGLRAAAGR